MYKVYLVNFGYDVYKGDDLKTAMDKLCGTGFETTLHASGKVIASYSPISGLRLYSN